MVDNNERILRPSLFGAEISASLASTALALPDYIPEVLPSTGEELVIEVDIERTEEVLGRLLDALGANEPPYNQERVRVAQDEKHMPESLVRGTTDHAMFLFNACYYMRGSIKSNDAVRWLAGIYDARPYLFNCEIASLLDPAQLAAILAAEEGLSRDKKAVSEHWVENAKRLQRRYDGDPRNIFKRADSYEQSLHLIKNDHKGGGFKGFQEKMVSMLTYFYRAEELVDQSYNFPIPIDFHAMRVSIANEMIRFPHAPRGTNLYTEQTAQVLRDLYADYAAKHNINPLMLSDAVWLLSESTCSRAPGNRTQKLTVQGENGADEEFLFPVPISPDSRADRTAYAASCGICPLENVCRHNIPGAYYYNKKGSNLIIREGDRLRLPRFPLPESVVQLSLVE